MIAKGDKVPSPGDRLMCGVRYMDSSLRIDAGMWCGLTFLEVGRPRKLHLTLASHAPCKSPPTRHSFYLPVSIFSPSRTPTLILRSLTYLSALAISHILVTSIWLSCESSSPFPVLATCRASASSIFATSTAAASRTS
jgi:hypothetical protein